MTIRPASLPTHRVVTATDAEGYTLRRGHSGKEDLQLWMKHIEDRAALNAHLNRDQAFVQFAGDGNLIAWPPGVHESQLLIDYVRELSTELDQMTAGPGAGPRIRLRLAIGAGQVAEAPQGITDEVPALVTRLVDCQPLRDALRDAPEASLAVIIDDRIYRDLVETGYRGLRAADFRHVQLTDKYQIRHDAWLSVHGQRRPAPAAGEPAASGAPATSTPGNSEPAASTGSVDFYNGPGSKVGGQVGTLHGGATFNIGR